MQVQFHSTEEFIEELRRDADQIDRRIVRVTGHFAQHAELPITLVKVIATARIADTVIRLDRRIGD